MLMVKRLKILKTDLSGSLKIRHRYYLNMFSTAVTEFHRLGHYIEQTFTWLTFLDSGKSKIEGPSLVRAFLLRHNLAEGIALVTKSKRGLNSLL